MSLFLILLGIFILFAAFGCDSLALALLGVILVVMGVLSL